MVFVQSTTGTRVIDKFQCDRSLLFSTFLLHSLLSLVHKTIFAFNEFLAFIYLFFFFKSNFQIIFFSNTFRSDVLQFAAMYVSLLALLKNLRFLFFVYCLPLLVFHIENFEKNLYHISVIYIYHCEYR